MQPTERRRFMACIAGLGWAAAARAQPATVDEADGVAKVLGYRADSRQVDAAKYPQHQAGQQCGNCHFFQGKAGDAQGPCPYFGGRVVSARGWCVAYATKGDSGGH